MRNYLLVLLLIPSFSAFSQVCSTLDLSSEGGILHPLRATDQNGLGICHIEQLQRLLKAKMPNNPDLARISLAILEKKERDKALASSAKKAIRWRDSKGIPGGTYIDAGSACQAYDLVKGHEICESVYDQMENLATVDPNNQKKVLNALSLYFDGKASSLRLNDEKSDFFKRIEREYEANLKLCPIDRAAVDSFAKEYSKDILGTLLDPETIATIDVPRYLKASNIEGYLFSLLPDLRWKLNGSLQLYVSYNKLVKSMSDQEKCAQRVFSLNSPGLCEANEMEAKGIFSLATFGLTGRDIYRLIDLSKDRDEYFTRAAKCSGAKIKIPSNLTCRSESLIELKRKSLGKEKYVEEFTRLIDKNLEANTPVGISLCTRFFKHPKVTTLKDDLSYGCGDRNDLDFKEGEGSHAVTIIGRRCVNGKTEFLIHNSWGAGCGYYSKSFECNKRGGFWVPSEIISQNSRAVSILK